MLLYDAKCSRAIFLFSIPASQEASQEIQQILIPSFSGGVADKLQAARVLRR
jgi:hypothetical protein